MSDSNCLKPLTPNQGEGSSTYKTPSAASIGQPRVSPPAPIDQGGGDIAQVEREGVCSVSGGVSYFPANVATHEAGVIMTLRHLLATCC